LPLSAFAAVGEQRRVAAQPIAALRDARHRTDLRLAIWRPGTAEAAKSVHPRGRRADS